MWGSPYRGYKGDYSVTHDWKWKDGLRNYYFPLDGKARARSASPPNKRAGRNPDQLRREQLLEIMDKVGKPNLARWCCNCCWR